MFPRFQPEEDVDGFLVASCGVVCPGDVHYFQTTPFRKSPIEMVGANAAGIRVPVGVRLVVRSRVIFNMDVDIVKGVIMKDRADLVNHIHIHNYSITLQLKKIIITKNTHQISLY